MRLRFKISISQVAIVAAFLVGWQSLQADKKLSLFLAYPSQLLSGKWLKDLPAWLPYFRFTTLEIAEAFALAVVVGLGLGSLFIEFPYIYGIFEPYIVWIYSIPKVVLLPIFILLFGLNSNTVILFSFFATFFIVLLGMVAGYQGIDKHLLNVAESLGMNTSQRLVKITLPALVPSLFSSFRQTLIFVVGSVLLAEIVLDIMGTGYLIDSFSYALNAVGLSAVIVIIALAVMFLNLLMLNIERRLNSWRS